MDSPKTQEPREEQDGEMEALNAGSHAQVRPAQGAADSGRVVS